MRGHLLAATPYKLHEIDDLPFPEVSEIFRQWRKFPPTHLLLRIQAQGMRWKPPFDPAQGFPMLDPKMMKQLGENVKPMSAMPKDVSDMFQSIREGKVPGLPNV